MRLIAFCMVIFLAGCAALPPAPQTPRQQMLAAYEALDTFVDNVKLAGASKQISAAQEIQLLTRANIAYTYLEDTRSFLAGTPPNELLCANAETCLQFAEKMLAEIQKQLPVENTK